MQHGPCWNSCCHPHSLVHWANEQTLIKFSYFFIFTHDWTVRFVVINSTNKTLSWYLTNSWWYWASVRTPLSLRSANSRSDTLITWTSSLWTPRTASLNVFAAITHQWTDVSCESVCKHWHKHTAMWRDPSNSVRQTDRGIGRLTDRQRDRQTRAYDSLLHTSIQQGQHSAALM